MHPDTAAQASRRTPDRPPRPNGDAETARRADFRWFFTAAVVSKLGTQISYLALPLVAVVTLDASPGQVGLLGALGTAAFLVVGLPAGAWLDRVRRRPVMIVADVVRGLLLASVPIAWAAGVLTLTQLYAVVLLTGAGTVFFDIAAQSYLPHVVGRDRLVAANSWLATADFAGQTGGRAAGGWLVQVLGAPLAVVVNAVGYLWSALWLVMVRAREPAVPAPPAGRRLVAEVRQGLVFVGRYPVLRAVTAAGGLTNLGVSMSSVMVPIVLIRELGLPETVLGAYLAAGGVGGLVGATVARPLSRLLGEGRSLWILGLAVVPAAMLTPLAGTLVPIWIAAGGWAVVCAKIGYDNVLLVSFRQRVTPDAVLARVNATIRVLLTGAVTIGSGVAGAVAELASPRAALWIGAGILTIIWVPVFCSPLRRIRTLTGEPADCRTGPPQPDTPVDDPGGAARRRRSAGMAWRTAVRSGRRPATALAFAALALTWGTSFALIKISLGAGLTPPQVVWARLVVGATALVVMCVAARTRPPRDRAFYGHMFVVAVLGCVLPFLMLAWAEQYVPSALAAILNAATPLATALITLVSSRAEPLTRLQVSGLALGLAGVLLTLGPSAGLLPGALAPVPVLACCAVACCYGIAYVYLRRFVTSPGERRDGSTSSPLMIATVQVGWSALVMVAATPLIGGPPARVTPSLLAAVAVLGAAGTGLAYVWNTIVNAAWGATRASTVTYVIPLVGVLTGVVLLGEDIAWHHAAGGAVILTGVAVTTFGRRDGRGR
ncbi:MFS transporter [Nonomuraea basaltis]|uniref:MFS transporter n=1 Tax=Nonomuraea basaltis TaxID=2495887 RepID=UPI0023F4BDE5|nr:MFS transporter [Nonomuraea basaltis]TMR92704.1 MFS transporter [Nonomuraea basaltis]